MEHQPTPIDPALAASNPALAEAIAKGYEPNDITLRSIFVFVGVLAVTLFVVLSVIYAIMMALAAYDRSSDPLASPIAVTLPRVYAPLQPSLGFYGNESQNHRVLDSDDLLVMRTQTEAELNAVAGVTTTGRHHIPIGDAMNQALPMLLTKNVIPSEAGQTYPPGSFEGRLGGTAVPEKKPGILSNDMKWLNDQGN